MHMQITTARYSVAFHLSWTASSIYSFSAVYIANHGTTIGISEGNCK
jgi:hypothetical protein